jgi:hypothetical protein
MLIYARKEEEQSAPSHAPTPNLAESTLDSNFSSAFNNGASRPCIEPQNKSAPTIPVPPERARDVVKTLNARHDEVCELYFRRSVPKILISHTGMEMKRSQTREKEVNEHFVELREWMRSVYTHWHVASVEEVRVDRHKTSGVEYVIRLRIS